MGVYIKENKAQPQNSPHHTQEPDSAFIYEADGNKGYSLAEALEDFRKGLGQHRLWRRLAWLDIQQKYQGSVLGPFWVTATSGAFAVGIGVVYSQIFQIALADYLPFVGIGIVLWGVIITILNEGTQVFISASGIIKQLRLPLSLFLFRAIYRNLISFAYRSIVIILLMLIMQVPLTWYTPLALLGIIILFMTSVWAVLLFGILSLRFRDMVPLINMLLTFSFFMTPIFWKAERLGEYSWVINFNPFYHFIEIVRQPLLGATPSATNYLVVVGLTLVLALTSFWLFAYTKRWISYWT